MTEYCSNGFVCKLLRGNLTFKTICDQNLREWSEIGFKVLVRIHGNTIYTWSKLTKQFLNLIETHPDATFADGQANWMLADATK